MKEKTINRVKQVAHIILVILSMMLSINLFIQFSDKPFIQVLFGLMAGSLELIKLYLLLEAKYHFHLDGWKNEAVGVTQFGVYLGLAFISIVASLGFTLVSIEEQTLQFEERREISNFEIEALQNEIESNNRQIEIVQENATALEFSAVERNAQANEQVRSLQDRNRELIAELSELRFQREESTVEERLTSNDMFILLGETVNLSGRDTMFYMMLVLVILLEVAIAITSGKIEKEIKLKKSSSGIMDYIDALFGEDGKRLVPDNRISKKLGITEEEASMYRDTLKELTYKGKPMINARRGGTIANFGKENMKKIVQFHIDSGKIS